MGVDAAFAQAILCGSLLPLRLGTSKGQAVLGCVAFAFGPCLCFAGAAKVDQLSSQLSTGGSSND